MEKKILVVDDRESNARVIAEMLNSLGYNSFFVFTGEKGIDFLINNSDINLVITDRDMPGMSGEKVIIWVKFYCFGTKTVLMSGGDPEEVRNAAKAVEADGVLFKPFFINDFKEVISRLIG